MSAHQDFQDLSKAVSGMQATMAVITVQLEVLPHINMALHGKDGIHTRLDRLEQTNARTEKWATAIGKTVIGVIVLAMGYVTVWLAKQM